MSKTVLSVKTRVTLNGKDISSEVRSISVDTEPGNLTTARAEFYVRDIEKNVEGDIVIHLGQPPAHYQRDNCGVPNHNTPELKRFYGCTPPCICGREWPCREAQ